MSVLIIFENKEVKPWVDLLKVKLPHTSIEVYPNVKDNSTVDFAICWKPKSGILSQFPNLKVIQSVGASVDHITNSQAISNSTIVTRIVDESLSNDMWEFLLTVVLANLKNSKTYLEQQNRRDWKQQQYQSINETTISILGLGQIGSYVAKKFAQVGFNVKGWSQSEKNIKNVDSFNGKNGFNKCLMGSDFLINLLPLTEATKKILNKTTLQKLPSSGFLINVGRGESLVDEDLIELLNTCKLSGAFLDVFRIEPLPKNHPFWIHPKIQITPHIASITRVESATDQIVENYLRFLNHENLLNTVSIIRGY